MVDKARSLNNLAGALYLDGDETGAIAAWRESISEQPTINALMNLGSVSFFDENFDQSESYYRQAQALAPQDQRIVGHLADALRAKGADASALYREAIELARDGLSIDPSDRELNGDVAGYFAALEDETEALKHLQLAATDRPGVDELYDHAVVYLRLGRLEEVKDYKARLKALGYPQRLLDGDANLRF